MKRPPIVVVMGHVDHGKTTLLDYIRKTNIAAREAGGITQSIGAYEIEYKGNKITFIDTPGHQAFSNMRKYGAKIADIAILVVAADDGVMPQTKEAIQIIQELKIPLIVAINKIDKSNANPEKTKNELLQAGVFLEKYGGNISWEEISALKGIGIDNLLDLIILTSEVENLEYSPTNTAYGIILKSTKDHQRGIVVGGILKDGTIKEGQNIATKSAAGKIKILNNFLGKKVKELLPSSPLEIMGFEEMPQVGEEFWAAEKLNIESIKINEIKNDKEILPTAENSLNIVIKADDLASLEALKNLILKTSVEKQINIIKEGVGNVTENDIKEALAFNAKVVSFKSKIDKAAAVLAKAQKIEILESNIIYELEKTIKEYLEKTSPKEMRSVLILKTFGTLKDQEQIVGGKVIRGPIKNQENFEIWNNNKKIGEGKILNLQSQRKDIMVAETNNEIGLLIETKEPVKSNYILIFK
jgi:translation initiation factor IF-2